MGSFRQAGLTLLEIVLVLAIAAILMGLAAPAFNHMQSQNARLSANRQLIDLHNLSRSNAVTRNTVITFCLSDEGTSCDRNASAFAIVFIDEDQNRVLDAGEILIQQTALNPATRYRMRFSGRDFVRYRADGSTMESGSFILCPRNGDNRYASRLIVFRSGRLRLGRDLNGDGVVNDIEGGPIICDQQG